MCTCGIFYIERFTLKLPLKDTKNISECDMHVKLAKFILVQVMRSSSLSSKTLP